MEAIKSIKVDKKIKPLHFKLRKEKDLVVGNSYFVSFGMNKAFPCKLIEVEDRGKGLRKSIKIEIENVSPQKYNGGYSLFGDEIGITPEEAIINTVTS